MAFDYHWECDHCEGEVKEPNDIGYSWCDTCGEWVKAKKVEEFDQDDIKYLRARGRGWED